ncbi:MAG TPA: family 43 glycosylhydrolase [Opitutaceae bacterium]|nr:family 43 glycosylhydrolase [Opitutaceae bacterium]
MPSLRLFLVRLTLAIASATGGAGLRAASWPLTGALGAHDPSIVREGTMWWCFTTGTGLPVKYSDDGLAWHQGVSLFSSELPWWRTYAPSMGTRDVWAPDIEKFGDRYWCYYCVSEFGRNNSAIGLKSCTSILAGDWRDDGFVLGSRSGVDAYNAIDPHLTIDADGAPWLAFGSWFDGIHLVRLDPATMKPMGTISTLAKRNGGIEGANIVYANGWYFLFVSIDVCCQGVNSTYKIACGRSSAIGGPYVDRSGMPMLVGGCTIIEVGGDRWKGPGGQDVYRNGDNWVIARHAYDALANGAPTLQIADLYWDGDGWPSLSVPPDAAPTPSLQPRSVANSANTRVALAAAVTSYPPAALQWQRNGVSLSGATASTLAIDALQPSDTGVYRALASNPAGTAASGFAIVGLAMSDKLLGAVEEVGPNTTHPNHNIYDQMLLEGTAASVTADPGQIVRTSFIDLDDDIVQVEFSGAGTVSILLDAPSPRAPPVNYDQPNVSYVKGHASIVVAGADETSNLAVFSVGRANAVNQALFRDGVAYDGVADIGFVAIMSTDGKFGGLRAGNVNFFDVRGLTGLYAPGVAFGGPVYVGNVQATDAATPALVIGAGDDVRITGGDLRQRDGRAVQVAGIARLQFTAGETSQGKSLPAQNNAARLEQDGVDVTAQIVVNPSP